MFADRLPLATIALLGAAALAGCATGPRVRADQDSTVSLASYKTFAFYEKAETDDSRYTTLLTSRLRDATRKQLENRGYVYDEATPQLRVNFHVKVVEKQDVQTTLHGAVPYRTYAPWRGYPQVETITYKAGTLGIDVVDTQRKALVWLGLAEGTMSNAALADPGTSIDKAVEAIFKQFPNG